MGEIFDMAGRRRRPPDGATHVHRPSVFAGRTSADAAADRLHPPGGQSGGGQATTAANSVSRRARGRTAPL